MNALDLELIQIKIQVITMINRVVLVGRLTRDPELRRTGNGTAVTSFNLAVNRTFQSADGQDADFIPCVCWNKLAENVEEYCFKGSLVGIEGRLRSRSYDNAQGQKVFVIEAVCDSVQFLESKKDRQQNAQQTQGYNQASQYQQPQHQSYGGNIGPGVQPQHPDWYSVNKVEDNRIDSFNIDPDDIQF